MGRRRGVDGPNPGSERLATVERPRPILDEFFACALDPTLSPDRIHRFHQSLRMWRTRWRVVRRLLPRGRRSKGDAVDRRTRRLARLVGEVRDLDVGLALLSEAVGTRGGGATSRPLHRARGRLTEVARTGRALLGAHLRAELERGLPEELERLLEDRPIPRGSANGALEEERRRGARRVHHAVRRARRRASPRRLHHLRVVLRRFRLLEEFATELAGLPPPAPPRKIRDLLRVLGRLHDLEQLLRSPAFGPDLPVRGGVLRSIERLRTVRRAEARSAIEDPGLRTTLRRWTGTVGEWDLPNVYEIPRFGDPERPLRRAEILPSPP